MQKGDVGVVVDASGGQQGIEVSFRKVASSSSRLRRRLAVWRKGPPGVTYDPLSLQPLVHLLDWTIKYDEVSTLLDPSDPLQANSTDNENLRARLTPVLVRGGGLAHDTCVTEAPPAIAPSRTHRSTSARTSSVCVISIQRGRLCCRCAQRRLQAGLSVWMAAQMYQIPMLISQKMPQS